MQLTLVEIKIIMNIHMVNCALSQSFISLILLLYPIIDFTIFHFRIFMFLACRFSVVEILELFSKDKFWLHCLTQYSIYICNVIFRKLLYNICMVLRTTHFNLALVMLLVYFLLVLMLLYLCIIHTTHIHIWLWNIINTFIYFYDIIIN